MSIYTKKGDRGETSVLDGERISKNSLIIDTIGAVDELNSFLGMIGDLENIQSNLFTINAILAGANIEFSESKTEDLEKEIDLIESSLPIQKKFILYAGDKKATMFFYARSICRRAERNLISLNESKIGVADTVLAYINRLSDYLYIKGRELNHKSKIPEKIWTSSKKS